jgi:hypothetical protein
MALTQACVMVNCIQYCPLPTRPSHEAAQASGQAKLQLHLSKLASVSGKKQCAHSEQRKPGHTPASHLDHPGFTRGQPLSDTWGSPPVTPPPNSH